LFLRSILCFNGSFSNPSSHSSDEGSNFPRFPPRDLVRCRRRGLVVVFVAGLGPDKERSMAPRARVSGSSFVRLGPRPSSSAGGSAPSEVDPSDRRAGHGPSPYEEGCPRRARARPSPFSNSNSGGTLGRGKKKKGQPPNVPDQIQGQKKKKRPRDPHPQAPRRAFRRHPRGPRPAAGRFHPMGAPPLRPLRTSGQLVVTSPSIPGPSLVGSRPITGPPRASR